MAKPSKIIIAKSVAVSTILNEGIEEKRIPKFVKLLLDAIDQVGSDDEFTLVEQNELEEFCKACKEAHDYVASNDIKNKNNGLEN